MSLDFQETSLCDEADAQLCAELFPEITVDWNDDNEKSELDSKPVTIMDSSLSSSSCSTESVSSQQGLRGMAPCSPPLQPMDADSFSFSLEPTPINPFGQMKVVKEIDLTASSSNGMIHEALFSNLSEILSGEDRPAPSMPMPLSYGNSSNITSNAPRPNPVPSSFSFPPPLSRQGMRSISESSNESSSSSENKTSSDRWYERLEDLKVFVQKHGHCHVPINYKPNLPLSKWTKRQRYQWKLKQTGKPSSMNEERQRLLEDLGFVWDVRNSVWDTRYRELVQFHKTHGHCNVAISCEECPKLGTWIKCQRRQYQLMKLGQKTHMTPVRVQQLNDLNFLWKGKLPAKEKK